VLVGLALSALRAALSILVADIPGLLRGSDAT